MDSKEKIESTLSELDSILDSKVYSCTISSGKRGKESEDTAKASKGSRKYIYSKGEKLKVLISNCNEIFKSLSEENRLDIALSFRTTYSQLIVTSNYGEYSTYMLSKNLKTVLMKCFTYVLCRHYLNVTNINFALKDTDFEYGAVVNDRRTNIHLEIGRESKLVIDYNSDLRIVINEDDFADYTIKQCNDLFDILVKSSRNIYKIALFKEYEAKYGKSKIVPLEEDRIDELPDVFRCEIVSEKPKVYLYKGTPFSIASNRLVIGNLDDYIAIFGSYEKDEHELLSMFKEIKSRIAELASVLEV